METKEYSSPLENEDHSEELHSEDAETETSYAGMDEELRRALDEDLDSAAANDPDFTPLSEQLAMLEALLFAAEEPLNEAALAQLIPDLIEAHVVSLVEDLEESYKEQQRGLTVQRVARGWRLATRAEYADVVRSLMKGKVRGKLSRASLETVAIIAYRQPASRSEIEIMRGVESSQVVRHLLERGLVKVVGRAEAPGRPLLYGTTDAFLEYFGLENLNALPKPEELLAGMDEVASGSEVAIARGPFAGKSSGVEEETYRTDEFLVSDALKEVRKERNRIDRNVLDSLDAAMKTVKKATRKSSEFLTDDDPPKCDS